MDDDKTQAAIKRAVEEHLDIEDEFAAEKLKVNTGINQRRNAALAKVVAKIAKLNITKEAFKLECKSERHIRSGVNVFPKIDNGEDLGLVGGFARVMLATGTFFKPLYDDKMREKMEELVEELEHAEAEEDAKVVPMRDAAE